MNKKILIFGKAEIGKTEISHKSPISIYDVDINKILVSNKDSFGKILLVKIFY